MRYKHYKKRIRLQFKRWKKYSWEDQQRIVSKYNVILLGHRTRREKLKSLFKKSNRETKAFEKFNRIVSMVSKGIDQFSKQMNILHLDDRQTHKNARRITKGLEKMSGIDSSNRYARLTRGSKEDYTALTNRTTRDYKALTG